LDNIKIDKEKEKDDDSDDLILSVEELVAMILKFSLSLVNRQFQITPKQCVITVPSGWSIN
jgi:molecular chaperone DnaK (HSP70)